MPLTEIEFYPGSTFSMRALGLVPQPPMDKEDKAKLGKPPRCPGKGVPGRTSIYICRVYTKAKQTTPLSPVPYQDNVVVLYGWLT
jgi:hypothetical protein